MTSAAIKSAVPTLANGADCPIHHTATSALFPANKTALSAVTAE